MTLGIIGAGGLGREVFIVAKKINAVTRRWDAIVFQDDDENISDINGVKCYGASELIREHAELEVVIAIGEPSVRDAVYARWKEMGIAFATLIHPGIYIDSTTSIGEGCVICEGATITSCVTIAENCHIHPHAVIGHDISIGRSSVIGSNSQIGGTNKIGDRFYLGFNAGTKEGLTIGRDVICAAGAIVFRDLPDEVIAVGNPARTVKKNEDKRVFGKIRRGEGAESGEA